MQDEKALEAWTFICMLILQWYYYLSDRIKRAGLSNKFAPMDMVRNLSRVRTVRVENKWIPEEIMKKGRPPVEAAGILQEKKKRRRPRMVPDRPLCLSM